MPAKKKRKYTFRKGRIIPYESGSLTHFVTKVERKREKEWTQALSTVKEKKRKTKR